MEINNHFFSFLALSFFALNSHAVELIECNGCSYSQMLDQAPRMTQNGQIAFYDPVDYEAYIFRVFTTKEGYFTRTDVFPTSFSSEDQIFLDSMFAYLDLTDSRRLAQRSLELNVNVTNVPEFKDLNAYDIYSTGRHRNSLSNYLDDLLMERRTGADLVPGLISAEALDYLDSFATLLQDIVLSQLDVDLSVDILVEFYDGSQVVFDSDVSNGGHAEHDRDDDRNYDSMGNPIIHSNQGGQVAGHYDYNGSELFEDISSAAEMWGIPVITGTASNINSSGSGGGSFECKVVGENKAECTYTHK